MKISTLILASLPFVASGAEIKGIATLLENALPAYSEERIRTLQEDVRIADKVTYRRPNGTLLAAKTITYRSELLPQFELQQTTPAFHVRVTHSRPGYADVFVASDGDTLRRQVELPAGTVVDAGFDALIRNHLQSLAQGKPLLFPMLVPEFGRVFQMRVERKTLNNGVLEVQLQANNMFIAMLGTPIRAGYRMQDGALLWYKGVSDLKQADGDNYEVQIVYKAP